MWINRKLVPLPNKEVDIIINHRDGEYICRWYPFDINNYYPDTMPGEGYLGTARVIEGKYKGIGFHAWQQNDSEFIEYKYYDTSNTD